MAPTALDLEALEALEREATPGPWRACVWDPMERPHVHADLPDEGHCSPRGDLPRSAKDAEFLAALRNSFPALAAEIRRLREKVAGLELALAIATRDGARALGKEGA